MIISDEEVKFLETQLRNIKSIASNPKTATPIKITLIECLAAAALEELEEYKKESGLTKLGESLCTS